MTEAEWLAGTDPTPMLEFVRAKASDRKFRLFGCACCRHIARKFSHPNFIQAVELAEEYADGRVGPEVCRSASEAVYGYYSSATPENDFRNCADLAVVWASGVPSPPDFAQRAAESVVLAVELAARSVARFETAELVVPPTWPLSPQVIDALVRVSEASDRFVEEVVGTVVVRELAFQIGVLRDILGNPFRPVVLEPSWLTSTVCILAEDIYAERAFDRMPILADALQDAGCDNADVLNHCRSEGPHVRGCRVVDLILGKS